MSDSSTSANRDFIKSIHAGSFNLKHVDEIRQKPVDENNMLGVLANIISNRRNALNDTSEDDADDSENDDW